MATLAIHPRNWKEALAWWEFVDRYRWTDLRRRAPLLVESGDLVGWKKNPLLSSGALLIQSGDRIDEVLLSELPEGVSPANLPHVSYWRSAFEYAAVSPSIWSTLATFAWLAVMVSFGLFHAEHRTVVTMLFLMPVLQMVASSTAYHVACARHVSNRSRISVRIELVLYMTLSIFLLGIIFKLI